MGISKYHYAYDENKTVIDIKNVSPEDRADHTFYCISCGDEMIAKLGNKNTHHFAHKNGDDSCCNETYLHKLGKFLLKKKFENFSTFEVIYSRNIECQKKLSCPFYEKECIEPVNETFDLKKYYDTCEEEKFFNNYRADLLLYDSTGRYKNVVFIEIHVTHECTQEKQFSGQRIIEIKIKSDDDLYSLINSPIKESKNIKFIGFNRTSKINKVLAKRNLFRFQLFKNGAAYVSNFEDMPTCNTKKMSPNSILELNIDYGYIGDTTAYDYGLATAINMGYKIKNCKLCKYKKSGFESSMSSIFCCLSKKYGTPTYPKQSDANKCQYFRLDMIRINTLNKELPNIAISKVE